MSILLIQAINRNHWKTVRRLLNTGTSANKSSDQWAPLHHASNNGSVKIVELLIAHDADVNKADNEGWTPLHFAGTNNYIRIVELLIASGADINKANKCGKTLLHFAADKGYKKLVELLLLHGADTNKRDYCRMTPVQYALKKGNKEIIEILTHSAKIMLLICAREFIAESLFHDDYLPRDMFCEIIKKMF